jgi:hypothetical protein
MHDEEVLVENFTGRRGKSSTGNMPSWALLSKWEQSGVWEDSNQIDKYQRSEIKDFSCEKPYWESDQQFNGGIDPHTGESRAGGSHSRSVLNLRHGGARNNTLPYNPEGSFIDYEFLGNNSAGFQPSRDKFNKNYTAGKQGVSHIGGDVNWTEYNRQRAYRGKYNKYYNDGDYSTVEHGMNPVKANENMMKAKFSGLQKLKRNYRTMDGRKPGKMPLYERAGEKTYHDVGQKYFEEKQQSNYQQKHPNSQVQGGQVYIDTDQNYTDGHFGKDNTTIQAPGDNSKAQMMSNMSAKVMEAFRDVNVHKSVNFIVNTLNDKNHAHNSDRYAESFTINNRTPGVENFQGGAAIQMNATESRTYEIGRLLQKEINNRKLNLQNPENIQRSTFAMTQIHEYMNLANRRLGPQEITLNLKEAALRTNLQPGAEVMDFMNSNKKSIAIDVLDLPRSQLNSKIAHFKDDSRATMNFSNIGPRNLNKLPVLQGEDYGSISDENPNYKSARLLHEGLKQAYFSDDMEFTEEKMDTARRSCAKGKGQTRRMANTSKDDFHNEDMSDIGHNVRNANK